jgi:hypothetical protein
MSLKKTITFAFAIVIVLALWRSAEGTNMTPSVQLKTTFDFNRYRVCGPGINSSCIVAIKFYDATSGQVLASAPTTPGATGRQVMVATARASSFPRRVYAATVYLDDHGETLEGPRGQTTEYKASKDANSHSLSKLRQ